jgi:hypothetical protein
MHKLLFTLVFSFLLFGFFNSKCIAQQVQFKNEQGKTITVKQGDQISLFYNGYLGQKQYHNADFLYGTDSSIVLGTNIQPKNEKNANFLLLHNMQKKEILFKDILAFRRISIGRKVLSSTIQFISIMSFAVALSEISDNNQLNFGQSLLYSLAGGIGISLFINIALPDNPKYTMSSGWQVQTIK